MSQRTQQVGVTAANSSGDMALTPAQCKVALVNALKQGLIDGSEINETWYHSLKRALHATMKEKSQPKKKESKKTDKAASNKVEKAVKPGSKTSDVVTGFRKFLEHHKPVALISDDMSSKIKEIKSKKDLETYLTGEGKALANLCIAWAKDHGYLVNGKASLPTDEEALNVLYETLSEDERKAARTWFPHFFQKKEDQSGNGPAQPGK